MVKGKNLSDFEYFIPCIDAFRDLLLTLCWLYFNTERILNITLICIVLIMVIMCYSVKINLKNLNMVVFSYIHPACLENWSVCNFTK